MAKVKLLTLADAFLAMVPKLTFKTTTLTAGSAVTIGTVTSGTDYEVTLGLPSGPRGLTGLTPNITTGTITTGAPGTLASVTIRGTVDNPILDLTIPRGTVGATPAFTIGTVTTGASGAVAAASVRGTAESPILDLTIPRGITGLTPNLTIGNVTTLAPGSNATASFRGTVDNPILDLALPRGTAGAGTGDVVAANNGSEYAANKDSFHATLGAGTGAGGGRAVYYATDASAVRTAIGAVAASAIGTAAMYNVGVTNGNIAVLESGGVFNAARIPVIMGHALDVLTPDGSTTAPGLRVRGASSSSSVNANTALLQFTANDGTVYGALTSPGAQQLNWDGIFYLPGATNAVGSFFRAGTSTAVMSIAGYWNAQGTTTLVDAATTNIDFSTGINFTLLTTTAIGNLRVLSASNAKVGQRGFIRVVQAAGLPTGTVHSIAFNGSFRYGDNTTSPIVNPGANAVTVFDYEITATGEVSITGGRTFASTSEFLTGTSTVALNVATFWNAQLPVTLVDNNGSIAIDLAQGINFTVQLTNAPAIPRIFANPTNAKVGQRGFIKVIQPASGVINSVGFGTNYRAEDNTTFPILNTALGSITVLRYEVTAASEITIFGGKPQSGNAEATAAEYRSATAGRVLAPDKVWAANVPVTLSESDFQNNLNFNNFINATVTVSTNSYGYFNVANPVAAGMKPGQSGCITFVVPTAGSGGLNNVFPFFNFGDQWFFSNGAPPTLPINNPGYTFRMYYTITSTTTVDVFFALNMGRTYDAQAKAYFDAMMVQPETSRKILINNLIVGLKNDGVWSLLDNLWLLASHDDQSSRVNAVRPSNVLTLYGSPYFVTNLGWQAASTSGQVANVGLQTPDAYNGGACKRQTAKDGSFGFWQNTTNSETGNGYLIGEATNNFYDYLGHSSGNTLTARIAGSNSALATGGQVKGLRAVSHVGADANQSIFYNSTGYTAAYGNQNNMTAGAKFFLLNAGNPGSYTGTTNRQAAAFTGQGLTSTQLVAMNTRLNTYLTAIGAN